MCIGYKGPETEAGGRIHTSAATVAVLPEAEDVDIRIDESDLRVDVFRASGRVGNRLIPLTQRFVLLICQLALLSASKMKNLNIRTGLRR